MFYNKKIKALESRVDELEKSVAALTESVRAQSNEIELLYAQFAGMQKTKEHSQPKPRRYKRKPCPNFDPIDGKENIEAAK